MFRVQGFVPFSNQMSSSTSSGQVIQLGFPCYNLYQFLRFPIQPSICKYSLAHWRTDQTSPEIALWMEWSSCFGSILLLDSVWYRSACKRIWETKGTELRVSLLEGYYSCFLHLERPTQSKCRDLQAAFRIKSLSMHQGHHTCPGKPIRSLW